MAEGYEHIPYTKRLYSGNPDNGSAHSTSEDIRNYENLLIKVNDSGMNIFTALHTATQIQCDLYVVGTDSAHSLSVIFTSYTEFIARNKGSAITNLSIFGITK